MALPIGGNQMSSPALASALSSQLGKGYSFAQRATGQGVGAAVPFLKASFCLGEGKTTGGATQNFKFKFPVKTVGKVGKVGKMLVIN